MPHTGPSRGVEPEWNQLPAQWRGMEIHAVQRLQWTSARVGGRPSSGTPRRGHAAVEAVSRCVGPDRRLFHRKNRAVAAKTAKQQFTRRATLATSRESILGYDSTHDVVLGASTEASGWLSEPVNTVRTRSHARSHDAGQRVPARRGVSQPLTRPSCGARGVGPWRLGVVAGGPEE